MDSPDRKDGSQEEYSDIMKKSSTFLEWEAKGIRQRGSGGMMNLLTEQGDGSEARHLINLFADNLGVERSDMINIDIGQLVSAIRFSIDRHKLGLPEENLERQSIPESVFEYVYKGFGKDGTGWRIGSASLMDSLREMAQDMNDDFKNSPIGQFLATLDFGDETNPQAPKLIVLHYPSLDPEEKIKVLDDANFQSVDPKRVEEINTFLHVFSLISQVYPGKFKDDNPGQHVILNVVDNSYTLFSARNREWFYTFESLLMLGRAVQTPDTYFKNEEILEASRPKM